MKRLRLNSVCDGEPRSPHPLLPLLVSAMGVAAGVMVMALLSEGIRAAGSYGDGMTEKTVAISPFHGVESSTAVEIVYTQSPRTEAVVLAPSGKIEGVNVKVDDGILKVWYSGANHMGRVMVKVSSPELDMVSLSSAAAFTANGETVFSSNLDIRAVAAASVSFGQLTARSVNVSVQSAATVYILTLQADAVAVEATSASTAKIKGMNVGNVTANAMSAGEIVLSGRCASYSGSSESGGEVKVRGLIKASPTASL